MQTTKAATTPAQEEWHFKDHAPGDPPVEDWMQPGWQNKTFWIFGSLMLILLVFEFSRLMWNVSKASPPHAPPTPSVRH